MPDQTGKQPSAHRRRRAAAEARFRFAGLAAVALSAGMVLFLLGAVAWRAAAGFTETRLVVPVDLTGMRVSPDRLASRGADLALSGAGLAEAVALSADRAFGPGGRHLLSTGAWLGVRDAVKRDPSLLRGRTVFELPAAAALDTAAEGRGTPDAQAALDRLERAGAVRRGFAWGMLSGADSTDPARAGIGGALRGSLMVVTVTLAIAFPMGLFAALWLEEYAPRARWTDLVEVSINNLAAVPSIIFGLLGLALFLGTLGMPRSAPLVGGLTLALMTMPVIVITARGSLRSVPSSVREAALAVGASRAQTVFHHVLPLAMPGVLTGTVIGTARALGETAPLLLLGMQAFIAAAPGGLKDPATVLPVQIFLWSDEVDAAFVDKSSAAVAVLLVVLLGANALAVTLRNRWEARR